MAKKLCSWKKAAIKERLSELKEIVDPPTYICRKCARVARETKYLCKPHPRS